MTRVSVGIFGFGRMGRLHARIFGDLAARFEVRGYVDPVLAPTMVSGGVPRFATAQDLVDEVDLLVVATPPALHVPLACLALDARKVVLVEKPLAPSVREARRVLAHARFSCLPTDNPRLFVGHSERFNPVVRALWQRLRAQAARVESIAIERTGPSAEAEDVVSNLGVHDFDLVEHLSGAPVRVVSAEGDATKTRVDLAFEWGPPPGGRATPPGGRASPPGGRAGTATVISARRPERVRRIRIETDREVLEGDLLSPRLVVRRRGERPATPTEDLLLPAEEPLRAQAEALADALLARGADTALPAAENPLATGADGLRAVELAEQAVSARDREDLAPQKLGPGLAPLLRTRYVALRR